MGTSKIILLTGVYMILGFYTVSFTQNENINYSNALDASTTLQSEQIAKSGLSLALTVMGGNSANTTISRTNYSVMGGNLTISARQPLGYPASQTQVVSIGTFNNHQVQITSDFQYHNGRWKVLKTFTQTLS